MEYVQERIATLHDLTDPVPDAPLSDSAVIVPMASREGGSAAADRTLAILSEVSPGEVIVPLRAPEAAVAEIDRWLSGFDLPLITLWCNGPRLTDLLSEEGLDGQGGKGTDLWLALGTAAERGEYVAVHDSDTTSYTAAHVPRLLAPLSTYGFTKGYYARFEDERLYGRLVRLFVVPLLRALSEEHDAAILEYLSAFRYALSGEVGMRAEVARAIRADPGWGFEAGTLGEAFSVVGSEGTAQVDLGTHEHEHRSVGGDSGLEAMAESVGEALCRAIEDGGVEPDYGRLPERYREHAEGLIRSYAADAAFNGLDYDAEVEREQVERYAGAIAPPCADPRLPAWEDAPIHPEEVLAAAAADLDAVR
ncbi:glycosyltransferase family protein [Natronorarus salvus]|uniref:glycosyl transferase family 2 n=1 Tax=Natronorarus salvus TaxID=3117733 RepID=UPI002F266F07